MRWTATEHAPPDEVFAPKVFYRVIGTIVPLTIMGDDAGRVRLVAAVVASDGKSVELTYETVDE